MIKKVLLIDDSLQTCKIITGMLEELDFKVVAKTSPGSALDYLQNNPTDLPDLLIVDLVMPEMSGFDLVAKTKQPPINLNLPIIMLSSKSNESDIVEGYKHGASVYITKPPRQEVLADAIKALENRQNISEW